MIIFLYFGLYILLAAISVPILIRLRPEWMLQENLHIDTEVKLQYPKWKSIAEPWVRPEERSNWNKWSEYPSLYSEEVLSLVFELGKRAEIAEQFPKVREEENAYEGISEKGIFLSILSPFVLLFIVPFSILTRASVSSVNKKTKLTEEMEREAREAQKEIEEILNI